MEILVTENNGETEIQVVIVLSCHLLSVTCKVNLQLLCQDFSGETLMSFWPFLCYIWSHYNYVWRWTSGTLLDLDSHFLQGVIAQVPEIILRCISRDEAALVVAQKVCCIMLNFSCEGVFLPNFALYCCNRFLRVCTRMLQTVNTLRLISKCWLLFETYAS